MRWQRSPAPWALSWGACFPRVFAIAKRVRTDTAIGENPVSVAYAAVDLARHIFADLNKCNALLVGAGETIELVARHLIEAGVSGIVIANRTLGRARELAQKFGAEAVLLAEIPEQLLDADIVITSTASQLPILGKGAVEQAIKARRHRPILMVDIAVPRDIEPQVGDLRDVYLYSVDDLREIVEQNMRSRHKEARKADQIIAEGVRLYMEDVRSLAAVDVVKDYRRMAEQMREPELQRALRGLARGEDPQQIVAQLARGITNKLIHAPTAGLRQASADGRQDLLAHARKLLGLAAGHRPEPAATDSDEEQDFELPARRSGKTRTHTAMKASLLTKLETLTDRHEEVSALLSDSETIADQDRFRALSREYSELEDVVRCYGLYSRVKSDLEEARQMLEDADPEVREMAREEVETGGERMAELELELQALHVAAGPHGFPQRVPGDSRRYRRRRGGDFLRRPVSHVFALCRAPGLEGGSAVRAPGRTRRLQGDHYPGRGA